MINYVDYYFEATGADVFTNKIEAQTAIGELAKKYTTNKSKYWINTFKGIGSNLSQWIPLNAANIKDGRGWLNGINKTENWTGNDGVIKFKEVIDQEVGADSSAKIKTIKVPLRNPHQGKKFDNVQIFKGSIDNLIEKLENKYKIIPNSVRDFIVKKGEELDPRKQPYQTALKLIKQTTLEWWYKNAAGSYSLDFSTIPKKIKGEKDLDKKEKMKNIYQNLIGHTISKSIKETLGK